MGMAASQARLLTITARIHDVEYEAQALQNAKIQLSTQSDRVYEDYLAALDATSLTVNTINNGSESTITANFNNLCSVDKVTTANGEEVAFFDKRGRLIVSDDVYNKYTSFSPSGGSDYENAICFAMYALGVTVSDGETSLFTAEQNVYNSLDKSTNTSLQDLYNNVLQALEDISLKHGDFAYSKDNAYANNLIEDYNNNNPDNPISDKEKATYESALLAFRTQLYKSNGDEIYHEATGNDKEDFDYNKFQYYVSIYNQIQSAGSCFPISDYNSGDSNSNAAGDSEWLKNMISCGDISMATVQTDSTGKVTFAATSPSSDSVVSYTQTTEIDKTALAKAEAEYEHDMKIIDKKDEQYDLELSKLESERTALTTEYDSVKKVIEDNVERTFGIFS